MIDTMIGNVLKYLRMINLYQQRKIYVLRIQGEQYLKLLEKEDTGHDHFKIINENFIEVS